MEQKKKIIKNWFRDEDVFTFTFAKDKEAIGINVEFTNGTITEDEVEKLQKISDQMIMRGWPNMKIKPGELKPISVEDYYSDEYYHPTDDLIPESSI